MEELYRFTCPCCWQTIAMFLDLSAGGQSYVEDCEVCCNPLEIAYTVRNGRIDRFDATPAQE